MAGMKRSAPADVAAPKRPMMSPRWVREPAVRDGRPEHVPDRAGANADDDPPEQEQLPELAHRQEGPKA